MIKLHLTFHRASIELENGKLLEINIDKIDDDSYILIADLFPDDKVWSADVDHPYIEVEL